LELLGVKLVLADKNYNQKQQFFDPLLDEDGKIIGT